MAALQYKSIQCLRGIAAVAVALSHLVIIEGKYSTGSTILPAIFSHGVVGVDLFFVISGFIITTVTSGQFERRGMTMRFLFHRLIRVYPIYWFYFILVLGVYLANPAMVNSGYGPPNLFTSFLLLPHENPPLLAVAWTLVYELFFYFSFAVALRWLRESHLLGALSIWAAATIVGVLILRPTSEQPFLNVVFNPYILEFIAGCFVARVVPWIGRGTGAAFLLTGLAMVVGGTLAIDAGAVPSLDVWRNVLVYGLGSAFLVIGCASLERNGMLERLPRTFVRIGDASYSLYLSHVLTMSVIGRIWHRFIDSPSVVSHVALLTIASAATIIWALLSYRFVEMPLLHYLRTITDRSARVVAGRERLVSR